MRLQVAGVGNFDIGDSGKRIGLTLKRLGGATLEVEVDYDDVDHLAVRHLLRALISDLHAAGWTVAVERY